MGDMIDRDAALALEDGAGFVDANAIRALPAVTVGVPTEAQIASACLSYDHSFGLMDGPQRVAMMHQAREWLHAWRKEFAALEPVTQPAPDAAAIREAWEKAYWRMRSYAVHDNACKLNKPPHFNGPCSCGLTAALEEALALISKGATEPAEYERKVAQMKKDFPNGI